MIEVIEKGNILGREEDAVERQGIGCYKEKQKAKEKRTILRRKDGRRKHRIKFEIERNKAEEGRKEGRKK